MPMVIHLEDQESAAALTRGLLGGPLADALVYCRNDDPALEKTSWERAWSAGIRGESEYGSEIVTFARELLGKDVPPQAATNGAPK
jgi:hypothetical protein